jgi:hypothetical protein
MISLLLVAVSVTIWLQYKTRLELRRDRQKTERLDELRQRHCAKVYDGWVQSTYIEFMKNFAETRGLDYMNVVAAMPKLAELKPDDIQIAPWDTPNDFIRRGRAAEIVFQSHPDVELVHSAIKKIDAAKTKVASTERCRRCSGTGEFRTSWGVDGICYACEGTGARKQP